MGTITYVAKRKIQKTGYSKTGTDLSVVPNSILSLPGASGNFASTPDSVNLSITGDLDVRSRSSLADWTPGSSMTIVGKFQNSGQLSWRLFVDTAGKLNYQWSANGTTSTTKTSSVAPTVSDGALLRVRVTHDVDNGAAGNDVKFWTSTDYDPDTQLGTWTQLGTTQTTAGTTSIFDGTDQVRVGQDSGQALNGSTMWVEIWSGLSGAVLKGYFDARDASGDNASTLVSSRTGETWTVNTSGGSIAKIIVRGFASASTNLSGLSSGQWVKSTGFANAANNDWFQATGNSTSTKLRSETKGPLPVTEAAGAAALLTGFFRGSGQTYALEFYSEEADPKLTATREQQTPLGGGTPETLLHRIEERTSLTVLGPNGDLIDEATLLPQYTEFAASVMGGEEFSYDKTGTIASPVNPTTCVLDDDSWVPTRVTPSLFKIKMTLLSTEIDDS